MPKRARRTPGVPRRDIAEEGVRLLEADEARRRAAELAAGNLPSPPCADTSAAGTRQTAPVDAARRMTPMQQAALEYLRAHPGATPTQIVEAVGVKGGFDNHAAFLWRLIDRAGLRLLPPAPTVTALVATGHGEYLPDHAGCGLTVETLWDPHDNGAQADLQLDEGGALERFLTEHPELDRAQVDALDADLTWSPVERWTATRTGWDAAYAGLAGQVAEVPGGDDDTFDYWPSGARLLLQIAGVLGEPWYADNAERVIRRTIDGIDADFRDELLQKVGFA